MREQCSRKIIACVALLLVVAALFANALYASTVESTVLEPGTFILLRGDFHVHTNASDCYYSPTEVIQLFKEKGYDVIAITDHDTTAGYEEAKRAGDQLGVIVIRGEEITCKFADGTHKDIIALFIGETIKRDWSCYRTEKVKPYFDKIHAQGGLGIVAHPWRSEWIHWKNYLGESYIDGWEYSWAGKWNYKNWVLRSSNIYYVCRDFHGGGLGGGSEKSMESYYTLLMCRSKTEAGVREALEAGRIVMFMFGKYYGSPEALGLFIQNEDWVAIRKWSP